MAVEAELKNKGVPYYKRLTANHENESEEMEDFHLGLRVLANAKDRLHLAALAKRWNAAEPPTNSDMEALPVLERMASTSALPRASAVIEALNAVAKQTQRLDLMSGLDALRKYADTLPEEGRRTIYEDAAVFAQEWDQYLRSDSQARTIGGFMSSKALGATQQATREGVALLTVHSSKGLEFHVVFVAGMAEGVFPDYRALNKKKEMDEEARNAFVAVTRSKRLLYLTYPRMRMMPWGDQRRQQPSRYLEVAKLI